MIDTDLHQAAEMRIDWMHAGLRRDFLSAFLVLDAATVHERAIHAGLSKSQTAAAWQRAGRILGLPMQGKTLFPAFQFDANGQPLALLKPVLGALPADRSAWQRALWLVAPNEWTRGIAPIEFIRRDDETVLMAARREAQSMLG